MSRSRGSLFLPPSSPILLAPFRSSHLHSACEPRSQADTMATQRRQCVAKFFASSELISKSKLPTVVFVCAGPVSMLMCRH